MDKRAKNPAYWEPESKWNSKYKNEIRAIQQVWAGVANKNQQTMALTFIIEIMSSRLDNQFYQNQRETDFSLGKKFVGDLIVGAIKAKTGQINPPSLCVPMAARLKIINHQPDPLCFLTKN